MKAFADKGRMSQLLVNMPVRVILESTHSADWRRGLCRGASRGDERDFAAGREHEVLATVDFIE